MTIIWALYGDKNSSKYYLLLSLGERNGKLFCLSTNHILDSELSRLKTHFQNIKLMDLDGQVAWIKKFMPTSFNRGFRTLDLSKLKIKDSYQPWSK